MQRLKRGGAVLAALALLVAATGTAFAAGGGDTGASGELMEISWLGDPAEDTWWQQQIGEMFNVRIVPNGVGRFDSEAQRIMVAAGEFPDTGAPTMDKFILYEDAVIRSIPVALLREAAPNYARAMDERFPAVWKVWQAPDNVDEQLGMSGISISNTTSVWHLFFRKDWLDNLGIELPGYEQSKRFVNGNVYYYENDAVDIELIERILVAFRDGDPDGNGQRDTVPYAAYTQGSASYDGWVWGAIQGALGLPRPDLDRNQIVDGQLYISLVSPRFKEFTKLIARWWDMELIDREWFTLDRARHWEKARTGAFGMVNSNWNYVGRLPARTPDALLNEQEAEAGVEIVMVAPKGPRGDQFAPMYGLSYVRDQIQVMNYQASDEMTRRVMQIQDTKFRVDDGTQEGVRLWLGWVPGYGQEGVHWNWSGEPYHSTIVKVEKDQLPAGTPNEGGFFTNYPNYNPVEAFAVSYGSDHFSFVRDHLHSPRVQGQTFATERMDVLNQTNFTAVVERKGEALRTMTQEFFAKAVTGEIDVDAEWDDYVRRWMQAGGNELMAEIEQMPRWAEFFGG